MVSIVQKVASLDEVSVQANKGNTQEPAGFPHKKLEAALQMPVDLEFGAELLEGLSKAAEEEKVESYTGILEDDGHTQNFHPFFKQADVPNTSALSKYPAIMMGNNKNSLPDLVNFNEKTQVIYTTPSTENHTLMLMDGKTPRFVQFSGKFLIVEMEIARIIELERSRNPDMLRTVRPCSPQSARDLSAVYMAVMKMKYKGKLGVGSDKPPHQIAAEVEAAKMLNISYANGTLKF